MSRPERGECSASSGENVHRALRAVAHGHCARRESARARIAARSLSGVQLGAAPSCRLAGRLVPVDGDIPSAPLATVIGVEEIIEAVEAQAADVVLLDIGGVLADDVWETMLLHPRDGIASRYGLDPAAVSEVGRELWEWASRRELEESRYWAALEETLSIEISGDARAGLESLIRGNPDAPRLAAGLVAAGARVGVLSNNTSFWWPKQLLLAGTPELGAAGLRFLSCERGVSKGDDPGLIELAAAQLNPSRPVLVDDRADHLMRAQAIGFGTVRYRFGRARQVIA